MEKELMRSREHKMVAGVCGGVGEYFSVDPTIIRIIWAAVTLAFLPGGIIAYIVAAIVMPERKSDYFHMDNSEYNEDEKKETPEGQREMPTVSSGFNSQRTRIVIGGALIFFGILFITKEFFYFDVKYFWPLIFIVGGAFIIYSGGRRSNEK